MCVFVCLFVFAIRSYLAQEQQQGEDKAEEEEEATKFINK